MRQVEMDTDVQSLTGMQATQLLLKSGTIRQDPCSRYNTTTNRLQDSLAHTGIIPKIVCINNKIHGFLVDINASSQKYVG
jgi:hypothetical protein